MAVTPCGASNRQLLLLLLLCLLHVTYGSVQSVQYVRSSVCRDMVLASSHRFQTSRMRSVVQCLAMCGEETTCVSAVYEGAGGLCHLGTTRAKEDCSNMASAGALDVYFEQVNVQAGCLNGGTLIPDNDTCICQDPYHGHRCELIFRDCHDVTAAVGTSGKTRTSVIHPASLPYPVTVSCHLPESRLYIFLNKNEGVDTNRTWQDYVRGFGDVSANHWVGLEPLHHITHSGRQYRLRVEVRKPDDESFYMFYENFTVADSSQGYRFSLYSEAGARSLNDCLSGLVGVPFSTYDRDSDGSASVNCALEHGCGWWYTGDNCVSECLPLGLLSSGSWQWSGLQTDAFWDSKNGEVSISRIKMFLL